MNKHWRLNGCLLIFSFNKETAKQALVATFRYMNTLIDIRSSKPENDLPAENNCHHRGENMTTVFRIAILAASLAGIITACGPGEGNTSNVSNNSDTAQPQPATSADSKPVKNGFDSIPKPGTEAWCPVMKNSFKVSKETESTVYKGKTYVFCCKGCKPAFESDPEKYLKEL